MGEETVTINKGTKPPAMVEHERQMRLIKAGKDPLKGDEIVQPDEGKPKKRSKTTATIDYDKLADIVARRVTTAMNTTPAPKQARVDAPQIVVKLENEYVEFQFMAYEFFIQDFTIPVLVDKDSFQAIPKSNQGFVLTIDAGSYPVIFIGKPVHFNTVDLGFITFMRDHDREKLQQE